MLKKKTIVCCCLILIEAAGKLWIYSNKERSQFDLQCSCDVRPARGKLQAHLHQVKKKRCPQFTLYCFSYALSSLIYNSANKLPWPCFWSRVNKLLALQTGEHVKHSPALQTAPIKAERISEWRDELAWFKVWPLLPWTVQSQVGKSKRRWRGSPPREIWAGWEGEHRDVRSSFPTNNTSKLRMKKKDFWIQRLRLTVWWGSGSWRSAVAWTTQPVCWDRRKKLPETHRISCRKMDRARKKR